MKNNAAIFAAAAILFFTVGALLGQSDMMFEQEHSKHYCAMTQIYIDTAGEYGWPDYDDRINCERD